jgi:hypothetical protein
MSPFGHRTSRHARLVVDIECRQGRGRDCSAHLRIPSWLGADSVEKRGPMSDIDTATADSLKVLDPKRLIREAEVARQDEEDRCWDP